MADPSSARAQGRTHILTLIWSARLAYREEETDQGSVRAMKTIKAAFSCQGQSDLRHEDGLSVLQIGSVVLGGESCFHDMFQL